MKETPHVDYVHKVENSYYVVCWGVVRSKLYCILQEDFESLYLKEKTKPKQNLKETSKRNSAFDNLHSFTRYVKQSLIHV